MENPTTEAARRDLMQRLLRLRDVVRCETSAGTKVWNVRDLDNPNCVYADTREVIR